VRPVIAVVDYDAGNLHSVAKALEAVGLRARVTAEPREVEAADGVILPGVGAFPDAMRRLGERGLVEPLRRHIAADRPFLGICLGLQLLFAWGEEGGGSPGLQAFAGRVVRLQAPGRKIPHMGWNAIRLHRESPLFAGIADGEYFYFVHSFHAVPERAEELVATTDYGGRVTAAVGRGRVHAVQFHPEKSSRAGLRVLANFGRLVAGGGAA
jgi:glutamine amidotransferase